MVEYLTSYVAFLDAVARITFFIAIIIFAAKDKNLWSILMLLGFLAYVVGSSELWVLGTEISESKQTGRGYNAELTQRYQMILVVTVLGFLLAACSFLVRNIVWIFRDRRRVSESSTN